MARSAPTVNGTPTYRRVSFRWIDASGDLRSDSLQTDATDAQIEAYAVDIGAISNADLYAIEVSDVYNSVADSSNAVDAVKDSVYDNIVILAKNAVNDSFRCFLPAPEGALFIAGTDQIDPTNADLAAWLTEILVLAGAGFSIVSARYTERREINEAVKF